MEEHLFCGKCNEVGKYNGQWIEGFYAFDDEMPVIAQSTDHGLVGYFCEHGSIGMYTGKTDKNGKKIFEGNIVSIYTPCNEKHNIGVIRFGYYASGIPAIFKTNLGFYIEWASEDNINRIDFGFWIQAYQDETEVIGNIHDNPELLEAEK